MFASQPSAPGPETQITVAHENRTMPASATKIREAVLEDYAQIALLQKRNGMLAKTREQWEHLWVHNPVYQKLEKWTIGWVAENREKQIVGYIGNIPLSFHFGSRELLACAIHAVVVDPPYRGSAGFLLRRLLNQKVPDFILTNTANAHSAKLNAAFRQPHVPTGHWDRSVYWITNYQGFLASALKNKGWPIALARPAAALLKMRDRTVKANGWMRLQHARLEPCSHFDERFDLFWEELKAAYPERLLADRSRLILQWHFHHAMANQQAWVVTAENDHHMRGYAVFLRQDNPDLNLLRVRLVDFQVLNGDVQLLVPMLAWAISECQKHGIHMLEAFGFRPEKQRVIETLAPYRRVFPWWWYFYKPVNKAMSAELGKPDVWDPSQYDGDASL